MDIPKRFHSWSSDFAPYQAINWLRQLDLLEANGARGGLPIEVASQVADHACVGPPPSAPPVNVYKTVKLPSVSNLNTTPQPSAPPGRVDPVLSDWRASADFAPTDRTVPNYEAVLPNETTKSVVVHGSDLHTAVKRVAQFADERSRAIRMKLDKNELKISSSSTDSGESEDSIETTYTADPLTIGFNSEYLIDFLKASGGSDVRLEFKDAQSAGQMGPEEGADDGFKYRYIVVPMRIYSC